MKAEELMIGNWITTFFDKNPKKIISGNMIDQITRYCEVVPIPITEEWLERFGFVYNEEFSIFNDWHYPYYVKEGVVILFNKTSEDNICYKGGYAEMREGNYHVVAARWIHHVHQLQNLYHALTGEELVRKEIENL